MPSLLTRLLIPSNIFFPSMYRSGKNFWLLELSFYHPQKMLKLGSSLLLFAEKVDELVRLDLLQLNSYRSALQPFYDATFYIFLFCGCFLFDFVLCCIQYDPETSHENVRYHGPPQVMYAYLKYQWSLGEDLKRKEAFARLQV